VKYRTRLSSIKNKVERDSSFLARSRFTIHSGVKSIKAFLRASVSGASEQVESILLKPAFDKLRISRPGKAERRGTGIRSRDLLYDTTKRSN